MGLSRLGWLPVLGVALVVAVVMCVPYRSVEVVTETGARIQLPNPDHLTPVSDAWDYLQLGRQLANGEGFTSNFTYVPFLPESAPILAEQGVFPLVWRQPGFPLLVAGAFRLAGSPHPNALVLLFALTVVALPLATYALARAVLSPGWSALAAVWTVANPIAVGIDDPLVVTPLFAAWTALLFAGALRRTAWGGALLLGLIVGCGILLRQETYLLLPAVIVMFLGARERGRPMGLAIVALAAFACVLPWLVRTAWVTGHPFFNATSLLYHDTPVFPEWAASRTLAVRDTTPLAFFAAHPGDVLQKTGMGLLRYGRDLLFTAGVLLPFAAWSALRRPVDPVARNFVHGVWVAGVVLVLVLSPLEHNARFLAPLVPLLAVLAALGLSRLPRARAWAMGVSLVVAVGFVMPLTTREVPDATDAAATVADLETLLLRSRGASGAPFTVVFCDAPTLYAWVYNRPAVWAPVVADVPRVRALVPVEWALLTCGASSFLEADLVAGYAEVGGVVDGIGCPSSVHWSLEVER